MGDNEEQFTQAKDFGFKLAMEVRQLRKTNEENKIHISDLTDTKDTMIKKYEALFAKHQASEKIREGSENKCLTLEDLVFKLEMQLKEERRKHEGELVMCKNKLDNLGGINQNLQLHLSKSTEEVTTHHNELLMVRNQLATTEGENSLHLQQLQNLADQVTKIQGLFDQETILTKTKDEEVITHLNHYPTALQESLLCLRYCLGQL